MVRKSRLRLDTLKSDYDEELISRSGANVSGGDGICSKFAAVLCSASGIMILASSFLLLRDDRLQAHWYWNSNSQWYGKPFPSVILGCAATNIASSILQIIGSLMFLFQDIQFKVWKWLNFTVLMISTISIILFETDHSDHSTQYDFPLYRFHFIALIVNCIICTFFLVLNILCTKRR